MYTDIAIVVVLSSLFFFVAAAAAENCFLRRTNPYKGEGCLPQKVRGYAQ